MRVKELYRRALGLQSFVCLIVKMVVQIIIEKMKVSFTETKVMFSVLELKTKKKIEVILSRLYPLLGL